MNDKKINVTTEMQFDEILTTQSLTIKNYFVYN